MSDSPKLVRPFWGRLVCVGLVACGCDTKGKLNEVSPGAPAALDSAANKDCCMGKNSCKGKGGCAVPESNSCAGKNDCQGKGGCNMHCQKK